MLVVMRLLGCLVTFLLLNESPNFVALDIFDGDVHNQPAHHLFALLASSYQDLQNRIAMDASQALGGPNRGSFDEQIEDSQDLFSGHRHASNERLSRFAVGLPALRATKPERAVSVNTRALAIDLAGSAKHCFRRF